jgi:hypothetical protein
VLICVGGDPPGLDQTLEEGNSTGFASSNNFRFKKMEFAVATIDRCLRLARGSPGLPGSVFQLMTVVRFIKIAQ